MIDLQLTIATVKYLWSKAQNQIKEIALLCKFMQQISPHQPVQIMLQVK